MRRINPSPRIDHRHDLDGRQVRQSEVVSRRECQHVAFARHGLSLKEARFKICLLAISGDAHSLAVNEVTYRPYCCHHRQLVLPSLRCSH